jgi:hypothetical protein
VQKRFGVPEVVTLEAAIDKDLLSAFVHGTSAYMRCNRAARLYHGPLVKNAPVRSTVSPDSGEPGSQEARDAQAQEARTYFSEGKKRSIDLLQKPICTLEDEIAEPLPVIAAPQNSNAPPDGRRSSNASTQPWWLWSQRGVASCGTMVARSQFMNQLIPYCTIASSPALVAGDRAQERFRPPHLPASPFLASPSQAAQRWLRGYYIRCSFHFGLPYWWDRGFWSRSRHNDTAWMGACSTFKGTLNAPSISDRHLKALQ